MFRWAYATIALAAGSAAQAEDLHLVCFGSGAATKVRGSSIFAQDQRGNSVSAIGTTATDRAYQDQVDLEIAGDTARVRMPRSMLPPLHGGKDGWMDVEKLRIDDRSINGSVGVNFINSPKLHVDRITGTISISGKAGDYSGQCRPVDASIRAF